MSGSRGWLLDNSGRHDRLVEHFENATGQTLASAESPGRSAVCEIEVLALRELYGRSPRGAALRMADSLGLYGVIGRLAAVRIYAGEDPVGDLVTGAGYVRQVFPGLSADGTAAAKDLLRQAGMQLETDSGVASALQATV